MKDKFNKINLTYDDLYNLAHSRIEPYSRLSLKLKKRYYNAAFRDYLKKGYDMEGIKEGSDLEDFYTEIIDLEKYIIHIEAGLPEDTFRSIFE